MMLDDNEYAPLLRAREKFVADLRVVDDVIAAGLDSGATHAQRSSIVALIRDLDRDAATYLRRRYEQKAERDRLYRYDWTTTRLLGIAQGLHLNGALIVAVNLVSFQANFWWAPFSAVGLALQVLGAVRTQRLRQAIIQFYIDKYRTKGEALCEE